jgi:hypothetical protein
VAGLILVGIVGLVLVLWAADRLYKAHVAARRRRMMTSRLTAATERADRQQDERHADAQAGAALTSFMPAIKHPSLTVPGVPPPGPRAGAGRERAAQREHGSGRESRRAVRTGEHPVRTGEHAVRADEPVRSGEHPAVRSGEHGARTGEHPVRTSE